MELAVVFTLPQEDPSVPLEGYAESSTHQNIPCIWSPACGLSLSPLPVSRNNLTHSTRLSLGERNLVSISGNTALSFFGMPLQNWLRYNVTLERAILPHLIPWRVFFPFTCWKLWLARNERIFNHQSHSQHSLLHLSVQAATEFHFLAGFVHQTPNLIPQIIRWHIPPSPFLKLNTDGSALGNPGLAGVGGVLRDH